MRGSEYADLIARYIVANFGNRGVSVYREVSIGKSIIGKNRRVDVFVVDEAQGRAFAIECKYQDSQGTVDEKIPYALDDIAAMHVSGCIVYAGTGFSEGVHHMLQAAAHAAYSLPDPDTLKRSSATRELDHMLAPQFGWWDLLVKGKRPVET